MDTYSARIQTSRLVRLVCTYDLQNTRHGFKRITAITFKFYSQCSPQVDYLSRQLQFRENLPKLSNQSLLCGLLGYLILFDPHTFVSQRQLSSAGYLHHRHSYTFPSFFRSTHNTPYFFIIQDSRYNMLLHLLLTEFFCCRHTSLHTLYTHSYRITLAPFVWPRLLARSWSGLYRCLIIILRHLSRFTTCQLSNPP